MHAVPLKGGAAHIARCDDGEGEDEACRAACLLADAVGIELEVGFAATAGELDITIAGIATGRAALNARMPLAMAVGVAGDVRQLIYTADDRYLLF
jgi:hypothetical protein